MYQNGSNQPSPTTNNNNMGFRQPRNMNNTSSNSNNQYIGDIPYGMTEQMMMMQQQQQQNNQLPPSQQQHYSPRSPSSPILYVHHSQQVQSPPPQQQLYNNMAMQQGSFMGSGGGIVYNQPHPSQQQTNNYIDDGNLSATGSVGSMRMAPSIGIRPSSNTSSYYAELQMESQALSQQFEKLKDQRNQVRNELGHLEELIFKYQERKSMMEDKERRLDKLQQTIRQKLKGVQEKIFKLDEKTNKGEEIKYKAQFNGKINNNNNGRGDETNNNQGSSPATIPEEEITNNLTNNNQILESITISDVQSEDDNESQNLDDIINEDIDDDAWSYTSGGSDLTSVSRVSLPANIYHQMSNNNRTQISHNVYRPQLSTRNKHRAFQHHTLDDVVFSTQFRTRSASFNFQQSTSGQMTPRTYRKKVLKELADSDTPFDLSECTLRGHTKSITSLHMIGSRFVISGSADCSVRVWDLQSKKCLQTLFGHSGWVRSVTSDFVDVTEGEEYERLIDDLKFVVSGSGDGTIRLWDVSNPDLEEKCLRILKGHEGGVTCVKSDINGVIISGSVDKTVKVWDKNQSECVQTLIGHERYVKTLQFKSQFLVTGGGDKCMRLWDLRSGKCNKRINTHDAINVLQFTDDRIIVGCQSGQILDYDLKAGKLLDSLASHGGPISGLKFLGSRLIFSSTVPITSAFKNGTNETAAYSSTRNSTSKMNGRSFLCLNPIEYNLETKKTTREFFGHIGSVNSLDFSSTKLVTGSTDHTIKSWTL